MPFAAALSTGMSTDYALADVCAQLRDRLPTAPDLAVVFFSPYHANMPSTIARTLYERLAPRCLVGCIGEAIVGTGREIEHEPALSVWLGAWGGRLEVEPFRLTPQQTPDGWSLLGWPDALVDGDPAQSVLLLFGDPFTFPAAEIFLPQINADCPGLRVLGGMASGMAGPGQTPLLLGPTVPDYGAVGVLLRGPAGMRSVVSQGCRPVGRPLVITKGHDNVVLELGGRPAMEQLQAMFKELPPRDQELFGHGPQVGLVLNEYQGRFDRGDFLVRNVYGHDRLTGALTITDRIRVGQTVQFHVRDADTADEDLRLLLRKERAARPAPPGGALLFTCNGRGTRMFLDPHHDAGVLRDELGEVPVAGFFAAGEIGPVGGRNFMHGFTASVVLFDEV